MPSPARLVWSCLSVVVCLALFVSVLGTPAPPVTAATATPTNQDLQDEIAKLKETLAKTRKDRDKYKARLAKSQDQVEDLQTQVADLEATVEALREESAPTPTPKPKPTTSKGATEEERQYWRSAKAIVAEMVEPALEIGNIVDDPNFATDPSLWFELVEAMRPFHGIWAEWQTLTYPTSRLKGYHTAMTDVLYNYDQAATKFEYGVNNLDATSVEAAADNLRAATEALDRATNEIKKWEKATGVKVADI